MRRHLAYIAVDTAADGLQLLCAIVGALMTHLRLAGRVDCGRQWTWLCPCTLQLLAQHRVLTTISILSVMPCNVTEFRELLAMLVNAV
jgi:hypothetical protein